MMQYVQVAYNKELQEETDHMVESMVIRASEYILHRGSSADYYFYLAYYIIGLFA